MCDCHGHDAHIHPFHCIVPPYMLQTLAMRGDAQLAEAARAQLAQAEDMRSERAALSGQLMEREADTGAASFVAYSASAPAAAGSRLLREVYDGQGKAALPGKLVRKEGDGPTGDPACDHVYDYAKNVYDLYLNELARDSVDGRGGKLIQTVHHRKKYNNAFWDGRQMAYGDGDGQIFSTFIELSVVGHEMSHGVVQYSGGLTYQGQSGALNESFADVLGTVIRQYAKGETIDKADWLIGKGILGPGINGVALRSMKAPGTAYSDALLGQDPQPYHMDFFVNTTSDGGGVHINSGIPNHAFYLYCRYLGGKSWGAPARIWYHALQRLNNTNASFYDWAVRTVDSAIQLYGVGATEVIMLKRAWRLVGLKV